MSLLESWVTVAAKYIYSPWARLFIQRGVIGVIGLLHSLTEDKADRAGTGGPLCEILAPPTPPGALAL